MTNNIEFVAKKAGRIDELLLENSSEITRSQIKNQIEKGRVFVNGVAITKAGKTAKVGDRIVAEFVLDEPLENAAPENIPLDIVYEDDSIAVINKPRGMTVHPAAGNREHTLANALAFYFDKLSDVNGGVRPGIVHRIDKDTTGLLVIAKNNKAHVSLAAQIERHSARRTYVALCEGVFKESEGTVDTLIDRDRRDRKKMAVSQTGKRAITHFKVLETFDGYSLVEFVLETGRTHQIRVHSKYLGHPIVGDNVYGIKKQKFAVDGQLLHAKKLELVHPQTHKKMEFFAPIPSDFEHVVDVLRKKSGND